jgi:hypothetical protein
MGAVDVAIPITYLRPFDYSSCARVFNVPYPALNRARPEEVRDVGTVAADLDRALDRATETRTSAPRSLIVRSRLTGFGFPANSSKTFPAVDIEDTTLSTRIR